MSAEKDNSKGGQRLARTPKPPKKKRTRKQVLQHRIFVAVTVIAALIVVLFVASKLLFVRPEVAPGLGSGGLNRPVGTDPDSSAAPDAALTEGRKSDAFFTFLVVGRDTGGGGNTDVIMLASYDAMNQTLNVMNIPRDTMVNASWDLKRLNSVYNYAGGGDEGIDALKEQVSLLVGFTPDFEVVVEWDAVGELAEAIGGVEFEVPFTMNYDDPAQDLHIHIKKGMQHLDGEGVMKVLRFRDGNNNTGYREGDIGRIKTQQKLLTEIIKKLLTVRDPAKILNLAEVFAKNVTTDLAVQNLFWLGKQAIIGSGSSGSLNIDDVNFHTMPHTGHSVYSRTMNNNQSYVTVNADELITLVNESFNPFNEKVTKDMLDLMSVDSRGRIASSTGVLKDSKANSAAQAASEKPKPTPTPEPSGSPDVSPSANPDAPSVTTSPNVTNPGGTTGGGTTGGGTTGGSSSGGTDTNQPSSSPQVTPPATSQQPTPTPSQPAASETPTLPPMPTPANTPNPEAPPEGIPLG